MANDKVYLNRMTFEGGVNNSVSDELIADNELADSRNMQPSLAGGGNLIKRGGDDLAIEGRTPSAGTINATSVYIGKLNQYFTDYSSGAAVKASVSDLDDGTVLASENTNLPQQIAWVTFNLKDIVLMAGHDCLSTSNGTTFAAVSNFPTDAKAYDMLAAYNGFLFTAYLNTLRWSAYGDETSWSATQALVFNEDARYGYLSALVQFRDRLVVFAYSGCYHIQGFSATDMTVTYANDSAGASSQHSTISTPFGLFWWSGTSGVCWSQDGYSIDYPMLRKLRSTLYAVVNNASYNATIPFCIYRPKEQCVSWYLPATAASASNTLRADYYPAQDAWFLHSGANVVTGASCGYINQNASGYGVSTAVYLGQRGKSKATVYVEDESEAPSDYDSVPAYVKTKRFSQSSPLTTKTCRNVMLTTKLASEAAVTFGYYQDNATSLTRSGSQTMAAGVDDKIIGCNASHRKIQFYLSDALNQRTEYHALTEEGTINDLG